EDKPILLDIGAVWCHWCHVMDGESYEDPEIAEALNRDFVCIKVDRDERPDVDASYQRAIQALSGQGGWPLTAFLTPEGEVFFGGTYFPPEDNPHGQPGFLSVLRHVARLYRARKRRTGTSSASRWTATSAPTSMRATSARSRRSPGRAAGRSLRSSRPRANSSSAAPISRRTTTRTACRASCRCCGTWRACT